jgi:lipoprotein NlpI
LKKGGAFEAMKQVLKTEGGTGPESPYAVILGCLTAQIGKNEGLAKEFLGPEAAKLDPARWPYPVVRFLRGEVDEAALLNLATDDEKRTEAHAYIGLDSLAKGKRERAVEHLRWVTEHSDPTFIEFRIAAAELDRAAAATR